MVLARAVLGSVPEPLDPAAIAQRLRQREPLCTIYCMPTERRPPLRRRDARTARSSRAAPPLQCHPLAGTIALPPNVAPDDYQNWLLGSTKNLHEHAVLVDDIVTTSPSVYDDIARRRRAVDRVASHGRAPGHLDQRDAPRGPEPRPTRSRCSALLHPTAGRRRHSARERLRLDPPPRAARRATTPDQFWDLYLAITCSYYFFQRQDVLTPNVIGKNLQEAAPFVADEAKTSGCLLNVKIRPGQRGRFWNKFRNRCKRFAPIKISS